MSRIVLPFVDAVLTVQVGNCTFDVPFTTTFAPMIGSPRSSVMIPVTFRSCVTGTEALPAFPRLTAIVLFSRLK